jgi:tetratricopeptide (TPR) repeat protein
LAEIPQAAREAIDRATACMDERRFVDAIVDSEEAARLCPGWAQPWWYLSVGYKHARLWPEALDASDRAIALDHENAQGLRWNAGIAATALGRWDRARAAWTALGIEVPAGDGPIDMNLGPTPIRISPDDEPEVVWCERLDPCRARIRSVPLPESGRRYFDIVLHDGEARGKRRIDDRAISVFDELDLLERSPYGTWEIVVNCPTPAAVDKIRGPLVEADLGVEDWTANFRVLCEKCSLGDPDEHEHDHGKSEGEWEPERRLGVAARSEADLRLLRVARFWWRRDVVSVRRVL